jgi:ferric citrate transport system permease protein
MKLTKAPIILGLTLLSGFIASLLFGATNLDLFQVIDGLHPSSEFYFTVHEYRLPRVIIAVIVGAMLATSGVLIQGIVRNPLASPDILGINHGAGLAAVLMMTLMPNLAPQWLPVASLLGGMLSALLLVTLSHKNDSPIKLAICGIALSSLFAGSTDFLMLIHPLDINNALLWLTGSLWGRSWPQLELILPWLILTSLVFKLSHPLNILVFGEERAKSLGISVVFCKYTTLFIAVSWTSAAVAICGPISFLGLVAPHMARQLVGGRHQLLLPTAMLMGSVLLVFADLFARIIDPPLELPTGIMTALLGAPYFLYLLVNMRKS